MNYAVDEEQVLKPMRRAMNSRHAEPLTVLQILKEHESNARFILHFQYYNTGLADFSIEWDERHATFLTYADWLKLRIFRLRGQTETERIFTKPLEACERLENYLTQFLAGEITLAQAIQAEELVLKIETANEPALPSPLSVFGRTEHQRGGAPRMGPVTTRRPRQRRRASG